MELLVELCELAPISSSTSIDLPKCAAKFTITTKKSGQSPLDKFTERQSRAGAQVCAHAFAGQR